LVVEVVRIGVVLQVQEVTIQLIGLLIYLFILT
jgi:hypothetical protein